MSRFKNTPVYYVLFEGGACGAFFATLVLKLLNKSTIKNTISKYGDAHPALEEEFFNNEDPIPGVGEWNDINNMHIVPKYKFYRPIDPNKPSVYFDHAAPDFDDFFSTFPNGKLLYITTTSKESLRVRGNFFLKVICNTEMTGLAGWERYMKMYPDLRGKTPDTLTLDDLFVILNPNGFGYNPKFKPFDVPPEYRNNIFQFRLSDIIHNKSQTLQRLSAITETPVSESVHEFYDAYLLAQAHLVKTKMPWLKD